MAFWLIQLFPSHSISNPLAKSVVCVRTFRIDHFSATSLLRLWDKPPPFPNWAVKIASQLPAPSTVVCSPELEVSHLKFTSPLMTPLLRILPGFSHPCKEQPMAFKTLNDLVHGYISSITAYSSHPLPTLPQPCWPLSCYPDPPSALPLRALACARPIFQNVLSPNIPMACPCPSFWPMHTGNLF